MKTKHHIISYLILTLIVAILVILSFIFPEFKQVIMPNNIKAFVLGFGSLSFIVYVLILALAVPVPIPSEPFILAGGYIFGVWIGIPLALIGMIIGSILSFFLSRWAGRPILKKMVDPHHLKHFNILFKKRGKMVILISYIFPIFPSDAVSLFLGTTKLTFTSFTLLVIIGHIPRVLIVTLLGQYIHLGLSPKTLIIIILSVSLILITIFREKIKRLAFKEIREIEKEAVKIEKKVIKIEKKIL